MRDLPHVVLEALACGTPVVTTARHGLGEVLTDGVDALLVDDEPGALATAFDRLAADEPLRRRLRNGARATGRQWTLDQCVDQLEALFNELVDPPPRVVFLGKTDMPAPPTRDDEQKYAINARHVSSYVVCTGEPAGLRRPAGAHAIALPRLHPAPLGSVFFYAAGPLLALRAAARRPPAAIVCQSPFEAFGVALLRGALPSGAATAAADRGARRLAHRHASLRRRAAARCSAPSPTGSRSGRCGVPTACAS